LPENGLTINQVINCSVLQENRGVYVLATLLLHLWDIRYFIRTNNYWKSV